jgi:APA family basic amino acid/polyamine antiporter
VAYALEQVGVRWASALVATGAFMGLTTVMLVLYYGLTRILFAMGRDGLLPPYLGHVNPRTQTPVRVIVICGVLMMVIAGFIPLGELAELVNIGTLAAFVMVCIGVIVLRRTRPDMHRPFVTPFSPLVPFLGALSCGALMAFLPVHTWERFIIWLAIGMVIYFGYSVRHSRLAAA